MRTDRYNTAYEPFDRIADFMPNLLGFLLILTIGYIIATVVAGIARKVLDKMGVDRHLQSSTAHSYVDRIMPGARAANGISRVVFWLVFGFFIVAAVGALGIPAVTAFMNDVLAYLPNIIVAILIFVVASLLAGAVAGGVTKVMGDTPTGKVVATVVPALVMVIAMFMILNQLRIAEEIVTIAFAATMGALALGLALAFGLGGRDVAARMLEDAYNKSQQAKEQAKDDLRTGRERAESLVEAHTDADHTSADHTDTATVTATQPAYYGDPVTGVESAHPNGGVAGTTDTGTDKDEGGPTATTPVVQ